MGISRDRFGHHRTLRRARVRPSAPTPALTLADYAIFEDRAYRVLVFDRAAYDAEPRGPKGRPLYVFPCETRGHQDHVAGILRDLRKALLPRREIP